MPIYEYQCRKCNKTFESYSTLPHTTMTETCQTCGGTGDRQYSLSVPKVFEPFTTRNILPDGEPVTVKGQGQLRQLEAEHHVKLVDKDQAPPQTMPSVI
jgi:putative FmdB family regulatory protein